LLFLYSYYFSSYSYAFNKCQRSGGKITDVINITLDFAGNENMEIKNISYDRKKLKTINKALYGEDVKNHDITDVDIHGEKIFDNKKIVHWRNNSFKKKILNKLKSIYKDTKGGLAINYSGHSARCRLKNGELRWCFSLPGMSVGNGYKVSEDEVFDYDENTENTFILIDDILDVAPAGKFIADSCFSGQLVLDIQKKIGDNHGIFVMASSMDFVSSLDKEGEGGLLYTALYNLVSAEERYLCDLDLDGDGIISEREAYFGIMANEFKGRLSDFKKKLGEQFKIKGVDQSTELQFSFSNPSKECFLPINYKCADTKKYPLRRCEGAKERYIKTVENLLYNLHEPGKLSFLSRKPNLVDNNKTLKNFDKEKSIEVGLFEPTKKVKRVKEVKGFERKGIQYMENIFVEWNNEMLKEISDKCKNRTEKSCNVSEGQEIFDMYIHDMKDILENISN